MRIRHPDDIQALYRHTRILAALTAWSELGCFVLLREGPRTVAELPGDPRALALTAPLLAHAGLLVGHGDRWALSSEGRRLLEQGALSGYHHSWLEDLASMTSVVREGGPVKDASGKSKRTDGGVQRDDPEATRSFLDMLYRGAADASELTAEWVQRHVPFGSRILDLGGGHGRYGRVLADVGYEVTLFDVPVVIPLARERHRSALSYREGDFLSDDLGGPYDLVLMSNIVHGLSELENLALLKRLRSVIAPGGWLLVKDMFLDGLGKGPEEAVQFNVTMLFYTDAGRCYGVEEYGQSCLEAGFQGWDPIVAPHYTLLFVRA